MPNMLERRLQWHSGQGLRLRLGIVATLALGTVVEYLSSG
jgi:hypothetical protein